ncbi:putative transmembrane protein [Mycobacterium xenopi 4042]|uniref:Putative transmembrane protein n=1 Tax=Mycobacterium xenopi 4042 TaxID=1299334 RepID=X8AFR1_MYCXE|nr:putative transmembrane protein [Mycobacterium xenopi 4042]
MPSIPQSLLWVSLVVLWLFVLVPMLVSKRDAVRRTSDVALATRVLNSAAGARLLRRSGPAAGHRSDPDWQPQDSDDVDDEDDGDESASTRPDSDDVDAVACDEAESVDEEPIAAADPGSNEAELDDAYSDEPDADGLRRTPLHTSMSRTRPVSRSRLTRQRRHPSGGALPIRLQDGRGSQCPQIPVPQADADDDGAEHARFGNGGIPGDAKRMVGLRRCRWPDAAVSGLSASADPNRAAAAAAADAADGAVAARRGKHPRPRAGPGAGAAATPGCGGAGDRRRRSDLRAPGIRAVRPHYDLPRAAGQ